MGELERHLGEECPECGTPGPQRHLSAVGGCGTCTASDPRPVFTPLRAPLPPAGVLAYDVVLPELPRGEPWTPFRSRLPRSARCYRLASGAMVHVRPDCRC